MTATNYPTEAEARDTIRVSRKPSLEDYDGDHQTFTGYDFFDRISGEHLGRVDKIEYHDHHRGDYGTRWAVVAAQPDSRGMTYIPGDSATRAGALAWFLQNRPQYRRTQEASHT